MTQRVAFAAVDAVGWGLLLALPPGCSCHRGCTAPSGGAVSGDADAPADEGTSAALGTRGASAYPTPRHIESVGDLFCINEAVAVPERFVRQRQLDPQAIASHLRDDASQAAAVGARTIRVNSATYPFTSWQEWSRQARSRDRTDRYLTLVMEAGLEPIVVLGPWPGNQTANHTERYVPDDMDGYTAWVARVVERYDGDGVDDAPGLPRGVRFWEVDNEPDLHNRVAPRGATREVDPSTFETPAQYAQVLVATAGAIHEASSDAVVFNGGTFHTGRSHGRAYMERVLAEDGVPQAVDAWSVHAYFEEKTPELYLASLDNAVDLAAGRPVFVTETSVPSSRRGSRWIDETFQARMVAFVHGEALSRGVERVCWHTLADPPQGPASAGGYATHSLYRFEGQGSSQRKVLKPSGQLYRQLTRRLGDVPVAEVRRVEVSGGRAVVVGSAGWLVYQGDEVQLPFLGGTVVDLLAGGEAPLDGPVSAPALVVPAASE